MPAAIVSKNTVAPNRNHSTSAPNRSVTPRAAPAIEMIAPALRAVGRMAVMSCWEEIGWAISRRSIQVSRHGRLALPPFTVLSDQIGSVGLAGKHGRTGCNHLMWAHIAVTAGG